MSNIIEQIKSNDVEVLDLNDLPEEYCKDPKDLFDALSGNTSIHTVKLHKDFLGCLFGEDRIAAVEAVSKLKNLQAATLGDSCLMVTAIQKLVKNAKNIKVLTLRQLVLQGLEKEFDELETVLYSHIAMKDFSMADCTAAMDGIDLEKVVCAGNSSKSTNPACAMPGARKISMDGAIAA